MSSRSSASGGKSENSTGSTDSEFWKIIDRAPISATITVPNPKNWWIFKKPSHLLLPIVVEIDLFLYSDFFSRIWIKAVCAMDETKVVERNSMSSHPMSEKPKPDR